MKRIISLIIAVVMIVLAVPIGVSAYSTYTEGHYTYTVIYGKATITDVNTSISGAVSIPDTLGGYPVTSVGGWAFYNCAKLTSINIPNSVTTIDSLAFDGCTSLKSINIPDSMTSIGYSAFYNCTSLTSINIPNSVTTIDILTFDGCTSLKSINIPDGMTSIGDSAFYDCISLTSITIPDSVTSIGEYVFFGCSNLTIYCTKNSSAHKYAINNDIPYEFITCKHSSTKIVNRTAATCNTNGNTGDTQCSVCGDIIKSGSVIPAKGHTAGNWEIVKKATKTSTGLRTKSCTSCGAELEREVLQKLTGTHTHTAGGWVTVKKATKTSTGLRTKSCTSCGAEVESQTIPKLSSNTTTTAPKDQTPVTPNDPTPVVLPQEPATAAPEPEETTTKKPKKTETAVLEDPTATDGHYTYKIKDGKAAITDVDTAISGDIVIPDTLGGYPVTSIGNSAFDSCENLTSVIIPDSVETIGHRAFAGCTNLKSAILHGGITIIGDRAFSGCENLIIYGFEESYVSQYANKNDLHFENIEEKKPMFNNDDIEAIKLTPKDSENSFVRYLIYIISAVLIIIVSVVAVIVILKRKKKHALSSTESVSENDSDGEVLTTFLEPMPENDTEEPYDGNK